MQYHISEMKVTESMEEKHCSYVSNLSSCQRGSLKDSALNRIGTIDPTMYRSSVLRTELSTQLGAGHCVGL